jgi:cell division protein FtsL
MASSRIAMVLLSLAVLVSAMAVIYIKHENRKHFVELQALLKQRDEMEINWGRLQLEQGAWATHGRIEQLARKKLDMITPPTQSVVVVQP